MIRIEKAIRHRNCYNCGKNIYATEYCARIYGNSSKSRSYCVTCMVQGTIKLIKASNASIDAESERLIKEHIVEVTI